MSTLRPSLSAEGVQLRAYTQLAGLASSAPVHGAGHLGDWIAFTDSRHDWSEAVRNSMKTGVRGIGWAVTVIRARQSGQPLDPDRSKLDLSRIEADVRAINRTLEGQSFRMAGFKTDKSYRNAKWAFRRIGRELKKIAQAEGFYLPHDTPYEPFVSRATRWERSAVRLFAARLHQRGLPPPQVTDADLAEHMVFLRTEMLGVRVSATLRRIVRAWNATVVENPHWSSTLLAMPDGGPKPVSPPFSAYPPAIQQEVEMVDRWMETGIDPGLEGAGRRGPFSSRCRRKPLRSDTRKHRIKCMRLILGTYVAIGHSPADIPSFRCVLLPETMQEILQVLWDRGQERLQATPEAERGYNGTGNTGQMDAVAQTFVLLATECFPQPLEIQKEMRALAKRARMPQPSEMTLKNRRRLEQFEDPIKLGLLLNLPRTLMDEAMALRAKRPAEAARLARDAVMFGIECRIPLRIKNLASCRIGHNLRFSGPDSEMVTLEYQENETKNDVMLEFFVGPRLRALLDKYIDNFLPLLAEKSPDFAEKRWLFPAGEGRSGHLSIARIRDIIIDTVLERVGAEFHPHLFRALAVKLALDDSPGALEHCRQLLGDKTLVVILRYYVHLMRKRASEHQDKLVDAEADRLAALATQYGRGSRIGSRA